MLGKYALGNYFKTALSKRKFYLFTAEKRKAKVNIVFYSSAMEGHTEDWHWHVDDLSTL